MNEAQIFTPRFLLRMLTPNDATPKYSSWLDEQAVSRFIRASSQDHDIEHLRAYIRERAERDDVLFLGIFTRDRMEHIGNIKFEPVDTARKYAIMGILIGESSWRGKGVASEVIMASAEWLYQHRNIRQILLGVSPANTSAIRAYKKMGFVEESESTKFIPPNPTENMKMVLHLNFHRLQRNEPDSLSRYLK